MADGGCVQETFNIGQIATALNRHKSAAEKRAIKEAWPFQKQPVRGGYRRLYSLVSLPQDVQAALLLRHMPVPQREPQPRKGTSDAERIASAHARYEAAPTSLREIADRAAKALIAVRHLVAGGESLMNARAAVAAELERDNVRGASVATLRRWANTVGNADQADWTALLLPAYTGRTATAACAPNAWDWYCGQYLSRAKPTHSDTYSRLVKIAAAQGWELPSQRTLERRMDREVSQVTQVIRREGPEAAARLLPTMQRDALTFAVGEAVNGDGLKFDRLWVRFEDGEIINTATAWFWQDLHSRRMLAWRLAKTENTDVFRLATYDLTGVCAPTHVWMDNTRVAANKLMTAGAEGRHRFKADADDGLGLLLMLGMEPHFTNPDKDTGNPGSKPIERAFGIGGIHEMVATNPRILQLGGYSKATAIDVAVLREVIAHEVARFNARTQRRTQACRGVLSFDQAWEAGLAQHPPRVLSQSQRRLLLMSREVVTSDKRTGELRIEAGRGPYGQNAYWCEHLAEHAGRKFAVHFDPENLSAGVHVYGLDGRYLFPADHIPRGAFNDTVAGREWNKFKKRVSKHRKAAAENETRMGALERAALYGNATDTPPEPNEAPLEMPIQNVVNGHFQRVADPVRDARRATGTHEREAQLGDLLQRIQRQQMANSLDDVGGDL